MPIPQTEILEKAERLAANLVGGPIKVGKNVLLSIVADFMSTPYPDRERLRRTLFLIGEGSGGHLKRGGGAYGDQIRTAVQEVSKALQDDLTDEELKSLFGWTARLLLVRKESLPIPAGPSPRQETRISKPPAAQKKAQRMGLGSKSLNALEQLKQQLQDKEKGSKR
jgi:hypothetical protein